MNLNRKVLAIFAGICLIAGAYSLFEPYWIEQKNYILSDTQIPQSFKGLKIVFLSDIHHGLFFSRSRLKNLVNQVNWINPDIILLGGDYVMWSGNYMKPCFEELANLKAALGVYAVLGNHDHWMGAPETREAITRTGIGNIDNGSFWITKGNQRIKIGGVGDHCEDIQVLEKTIDDVSDSDFVVLVSHSPDYAEEMECSKVDLMFSGHTHGGQVTFFSLFALKVPSDYGQKYRTGLVQKGNLRVIVSNGVGTVALPIRFFARPQIVSVILK